MRACALMLLAVVSCASRSELGEGGSAATGGGSTTSSTGSALQPTNLCSPASVRLCDGAQCPAPPCQCMPASDRDTSTPSEAGLCWTDLADWPNDECYACEDGQACIHRATDELHCAPLDVCVSLAALGASNVCTYADKSPFDDRPLAVGGACPVQDHSLCGGGCGDCQTNFRCTGRSADRGFGVCVPLSPLDKKPFPCSYGDTGPAQTPCLEQYNYFCAVYKSSNERLARHYGMCMQLGPCKSASQIVGLHCLDVAGYEHAP